MENYELKELEYKFNESTFLISLKALCRDNLYITIKKQNSLTVYQDEIAFDALITMSPKFEIYGKDRCLTLFEKIKPKFETNKISKRIQ